MMSINLLASHVQYSIRRQSVTECMEYHTTVSRPSTLSLQKRSEVVGRMNITVSSSLFKVCHCVFVSVLLRQLLLFFFSYSKHKSSSTSSPKLVRCCQISSPGIVFPGRSGGAFAVLFPVFTVRLHVMQRTVLLSQFCQSARLSICLSVRLTDSCIVTKLNMMRCGYFDTTRNGDHSSFLKPTVVGERCPIPSEICVQSDPPPSKNGDLDRFPVTTSEA